MATENFDGYAHVDNLMQKALKQDNVQEELKQAYVAWSKTYDKVNRNFFNSSARAMEHYNFIHPIYLKSYKTKPSFASISGPGVLLEISAVIPQILGGFSTHTRAKIPKIRGRADC